MTNISKEEAITDIIEVWDSYAVIANPQYLSTDKRVGDELLELLKQIEDCDKLKRVRVYVKEALADDPYITAGRVYDLERVDRDGYYWISGPAISGDVDTACCCPKDCIIVEGELPPNE